MLNVRERWDVKDMFLDLISQILSIFLLVLCESVLFNEGFSTEILFQAICRTLNRSTCLAFDPFSQFYEKVLSYQRNRPLVSSVGRAPVYWAGGRLFKPRTDQHSGSLNN